MNVKFSDFMGLNLYDLGKAAIVTAISSIISAVFQTFQDGKFPTTAEWKGAAIVGLTAGIGYVLKNLFSTAPKSVEVNTAKTTVIDTHSKEVISAANDMSIVR